MKHLLNNLSEEEKNNIREQHEGGMNLAIDNFKKLVETKLGDAKPYLNEELGEQNNSVSKEGGMELRPLNDKELKDLAKQIVDCLDENGKKLLFKLNHESKNHKPFFDMAMIEMEKFINSFGPKGPLG